MASNKMTNTNIVAEVDATALTSTTPTAFRVKGAAGEGLSLATLDLEDQDTQAFLRSFGGEELARLARQVSPESSQEEKERLLDAARENYLFSRRVGAAAFYNAALVVVTIRDRVIGAGEKGWYQKIAQTGLCSQAEAYNLARIIDNDLEPSDLEDPLTGGTIDKVAMNKLLAKKANPDKSDPNSAIAKAIAATKEGEKVTATKAEELIRESTGADPSASQPASHQRPERPEGDVDDIDVDDIDIEVETEDDTAALERQARKIAEAIEDNEDDEDDEDKNSEIESLEGLLSDSQKENKELKERLAQNEAALAQLEAVHQAPDPESQKVAQTGLRFDEQELADFFGDWINIWGSDRRKTLEKMILDGHANSNLGVEYTSFCDAFGLDKEIVKQAIADAAATE